MLWKLVFQYSIDYQNLVCFGLLQKFIRYKDSLWQLSQGRDSEGGTTF
jgi:hypothetical protein